MSVFYNKIYLSIISGFVIEEFTIWFITFFDKLSEDKILHKLSGVRRVLYSLGGNQSVVYNVCFLGRLYSGTCFA